MDINYQNILEPAKISSELYHHITDFLYDHLDQYGDTREAISKCLDYAMGKNQRPGGAVFLALEHEKIIGAVITNKTGMEGYIPENILVYIAMHGDYRGKGIGKTLMQNTMSHVPGDIALHVEPENPAVHLYRKMGFTSKYLEMRFHRAK